MTRGPFESQVDHNLLTAHTKLRDARALLRQAAFLVGTTTTEEVGALGSFCDNHIDTLMWKLETIIRQRKRTALEAESIEDWTVNAEGFIVAPLDWKGELGG